MKKKQFTYIGVLLILFIVNTIMVCTNQIKAIDDFLYETIIHQRSPLFDFLLTTITKLGNTITIIVLGIILLITLPKKEKIQILISIPLTSSINYIVKNIVKRPRPNHIRLIKQGGFSYPSGHAMISIAVYGLLFYFVQKKIENKAIKNALSVLLGTIILLIGVSRVYVGVHYPSDIIGGYLLALIIQIIMIHIINKKLGGNTSDQNDCK